MSELDLISEWFRFAASDLFTAKHMFNDVYPPHIEVSCYHYNFCLSKIQELQKPAQPAQSPFTSLIM
jgi:hypothetical protein